MSQSAIPDIQKLVQLIEETISQESNDSSRIMSFLGECRQLGVEILPVDINRSGTSCSIEDEKNIRVGFSLLISGKKPFIENILAERQQNGQFRSFQEFCERTELDSIPEDFIIRCIQVGVFDSIETSRSRLFLGREKILQAVRKANAEKSAGQFSLFTASPESQTVAIELPDAEEWTEEEMIVQEKAAAGFSFTEHLFRSEDENTSEQDFSKSNLAAKTAIVTSPEGDADAEEAETPPPAFIIQLSTTKTTAQTLMQLRETVRKYPGNSEVMLEFIDDKNNKTHIRTHTDYSVQISEDLVKETEALILDYS